MYFRYAQNSVKSWKISPHCTHTTQLESYKSTRAFLIMFLVSLRRRCSIVFVIVYSIWVHCNRSNCNPKLDVRRVTSLYAEMNFWQHRRPHSLFLSFCNLTLGGDISMRAKNIGNLRAVTIIIVKILALWLFLFGHSIFWFRN